MDIKLANLIKEFALEQEKPQVNRYEVTEAIRNYARIGEQLRVNNNIMEAAKQLARMAEDAQHHVLGENDDWFDSVSIKRNMKELKGLTGQFKKTAVEANATNQRLSALYEDMGNILKRYYEIDEALDPVDPKKVEPEDDYEDREDKDIDNDGDTDDSDEYLHKKRQAITKAIKKENISNLGNFLPKTLKEFGPSPMDRALKQTLKDPKSGKEVTVGSVKNQGEKKYDSALVKKANAIFKKAMEKERAVKAKIRKMQGEGTVNEVDAATQKKIDQVIKQKKAAIKKMDSLVNPSMKASYSNDISKLNAKLRKLRGDN